MSYEIEDTPPKKSPFRESKKTIGYLSYSGDIAWTNYKEIGMETFVDKANICKKCQLGVDAILETLKKIFHPLQGSANNG